MVNKFVSISNGLCLNKRKYCLELLDEYAMLSCMPATTPLETNLVVNYSDFVKNDELLINKSEFQKLIGNLIYLTITRPDISYAVRVLSQYMDKPRKSYLKIDFRLLRYLKNTTDKRIALTKTNVFELKGFCRSRLG